MKKKSNVIQVKPCTWDGQGKPLKYQAIATIMCADNQKRMFIGDPSWDKNESLAKLHAEILRWGEACREAKEAISEFKIQ